MAPFTEIPCDAICAIASAMDDARDVISFVRSCRRIRHAVLGKLTSLAAPISGIDERVVKFVRSLRALKCLALSGAIDDVTSNHCWRCAVVRTCATQVPVGVFLDLAAHLLSPDGRRYCKHCGRCSLSLRSSVEMFADVDPGRITQRQIKRESLLERVNYERESPMRNGHKGGMPTHFLQPSRSRQASINSTCKHGSGKVFRSEDGDDEEGGRPLFARSL